jgi:osmotically-inducible protein OsmY
MAGKPTERVNERDMDAAAERDYERRFGRRPEGVAGMQRPVEGRSWWNRASDEVSSWFGNPGALSRRQRDQAVGDHRGEGPQSDLDPDARIVDDVSKRLTEDAQINASKVEVVARAGEVTLNGTVTTSAERARAEELAAAVAGVNQVQNKLLVA